MRSLAGVLLTALLLAALAGGCSQPRLLTREDYAPAVAAFAGGSAREAEVRLPRGEAGAFITTMERTYLALLQGRPAIDDLKRYADLLEDRFRIDVRRELRSFFYVETPEGYYASEHEVIWMHLLLSWGYSLRGESESGCVEAREASRLLSARWSEEGRFDDPMLRALLGVLWAWCGSWEDAQVDFRRAAELEPSLDWARALAQREQPPADLFLVLGGPGPTPAWSPALELNPLRGVRQIDFRFHGRRSQAGVETPTELVDLHRTPDAAPWYRRHILRDNAIHELIADSRYGVDSALDMGEYGAKTAGGIALGSAIVVGSVVGGAAIVYLAVHGNSAEGVVLGVSVALAGSGYGINLARRVERQSRQTLKDRSDPARVYRFVRFLPEYAWIGWSERPLQAEPWFTRADGMESEVQGPLATVRAREPRIFLGFRPDTAPPVAR